MTNIFFSFGNHRVILLCLIEIDFHPVLIFHSSKKIVIAKVSIVVFLLLAICMLVQGAADMLFQLEFGSLNY